MFLYNHAIFQYMYLREPVFGQFYHINSGILGRYTWYIQDKACPVNVWLSKLTALDMTPLGWLGRKTSLQTNKHDTFWVAEWRSTSNYLDNRMYGSLTCTHGYLIFHAEAREGPSKDCTVMSSLQITKESVFGFHLLLFFFFSRQWPRLNVPPALEAIGHTRGTCCCPSLREA